MLLPITSYLLSKSHLPDMMLHFSPLMHCPGPSHSLQTRQLQWLYTVPLSQFNDSVGMHGKLQSSIISDDFTPTATNKTVKPNSKALFIFLEMKITFLSSKLFWFKAQHTMANDSYKPAYIALELRLEHNLHNNWHLIYPT